MTGFVMGDHFMEDTPMGEGCSQTLIKLTKDKRIISCAACVNPPSQMPAVWDITSIVRKDKVRFLSSLPGFSITPACEDSHQEKEWGQFLDFLQKHNRVAISNFGLFELYILPPLEGSKYDLATVRFKGKASKTSP
ncbi:uncharacterized protein LOC121789513, partial [Salvia splendens]